MYYQTYAELRDKAGVTDYQVAKATDISTATLANWKANRYTPKVDKLKKIADYFNVSVDYFCEKELENASD